MALHSGSSERTVVVVGPCGSGKSALCNLLAGKQLFPEKSNAMAGNTKPVIFTMPFRGTDSPTLRLVDTQGLSDPGGRDDRIYSDLIDCVAPLTSVHLFLIVINGTDARISSELQNNIKALVALFPKENLLNHAALVFTHWSVSRPPCPRDQKSREFNTVLQGLGADKDVPCFFIDNTFDRPFKDKFLPRAEQKAFSDEIARLRRLLLSVHATDKMVVLEGDAVGPLRAQNNALAQELQAARGTAVRYETALTTTYNATRVAWENSLAFSKMAGAVVGTAAVVGGGYIIKSRL